MKREFMIILLIFFMLIIDSNCDYCKGKFINCPGGNCNYCLCDYFPEPISIKAECAKYPSWEQ